MEPANITSDGTLAIDMYTVATPSRPRAAEGWRSAGSSGPGAADGAAARVGVPIVAVPLRPGKQWEPEGWKQAAWKTERCSGTDRSKGG